VNITPPSNDATRKPILKARGISKRFGGIQALQDVDLDVYDKEVLALLGDNGAGKSTLIKIISGAYTPDSGEILFDGKKTQITSPDYARRIGIKTVYQDLALFGILDVTSNFFAGAEYTRWGFIQRKRMDREASELLKGMKTTVKSLRQEVRSLSGGQQHAVAIGRGVYIGHQPRLIIMDEPSAGLGITESREVLELIKDLGHKVAVILITHNLDYAFEVATRAVVLCNGQVTGQATLSETTESDIISLMMGVTDKTPTT